MFVSTIIKGTIETMNYEVKENKNKTKTMKLSL
jgi:hypothetical protein